MSLPPPRSTLFPYTTLFRSQSNALDLLDVPTVYRLSVFYNQLNQGIEQFYQIRMLSEQYFLPLLDEGADGVYDETSGDLRPAVGWYRPSLRRHGAPPAVLAVLGDT